MGKDSRITVRVPSVVHREWSNGERKLHLCNWEDMCKPFDKGV